MATRASSKKRGRSLRNNVEGTSTIRDSENLDDIISVSESDSIMTRCNKKKYKTSNQGHLIKPKARQNTFGTSRADNIRRIKSISSDIIISPPFFTNEFNEKHNGVAKERMKNTARFVIPKKKNSNQKSCISSSKQSKKSTVSNFRNRKHFSDNALKPLDDWHIRFNSLMDLRKEKSENNHTFFSRSYFRQNVFSLSSSDTLSFDHVNSNHKKIPFDYLKEFDLIRYGNLPRKLNKHCGNKNIFSLVPRISPSVPVTLPKKKYSHGILLIKDSKVVTEKKDEKDLNEATLRIEVENEDVCCSSSDSEVTLHLEDNECLNNIQLRNDNNYISFEKPIRIKCVDEASDKLNEIVIYSDEFLKDLIKVKDKCATKKEICERILLESTDYKGKNLRIITNVEKYFPIPNSKVKSRRNTECTSVKAPIKMQTKHSKDTKIRKQKSEISRINKICKSSKSSEQIKKQTITEQNICLNSNISNDKTDIKSVVISFSEVNDHLGHAKNKKRSNGIKLIKREYKDFESKNDNKSRTALKNINFEHFIASSFSCYFQFFAKLGHPVKNGTVISKNNSTKWLKKCSIIYDNATKNMTEKCFMSVAKAKCVLNIYDYIKCLNKIARNRRMLLIDLLHQMMRVDLQYFKKSDEKKVENQQDESIGQDTIPETTKSKSQENCI